MGDGSADQRGQRPELPSGLIAAACSRFETAWRTGQQPRIEDFLPAESPGKNEATQRSLLVNLVGIDLDWRWKTAAIPSPPAPLPEGEGGQSDSPLPRAGEGPEVISSTRPGHHVLMVAGEGQGVRAIPLRPRLADYVTRYSLLGRVEQLPVDLIVNEYYARRRYGDRPTHAEYLDAFGSRHPDLAKQLQAIDDGMDLGTTAGWSAAEPATTLKEGSLLGHYRIVHSLGGGGMGWVYLAHDEELDKPFAVKVPHRRLFRSDEEVQRFLGEARTAARLKHASIVPIHYFGRESDGTCYIVMEHIDGPSLAERLRSGPLPPEQAAAILATVAEAVAHIHKKGFVHRDLKPRNILLDAEGRPHVADFGLALHESAQRHLVGDSSGTLAYMSPEQVEGKAQWLDGRADLWALGVILYEMLTGRRPFQGETRGEVAQEILHREPKPPRAINDQVPAELERICLKCLAKPISDRYRTADDLIADLRRWQRPRRHRAVLAAAIGAAVILLGVASWKLLPSPEYGRGAGGEGILPPLSASLDLLVWNKVDPARRGVSLRAPHIMPLRPEDWIRVKAELSRPAYVYLIWIDSQGRASPVYPWKPGAWTGLPAKQSPTERLSLPEAADEGWPIEGPGGMETLLLLAREEPLPSAMDVAGLLAGLPRQPMFDENLLAWFDNGSLVTRDMDHLRGLGFQQQGRIDDAVLKTQRLIQERLAPYFPLIRTVTVASKGA